MAVGDSEMKTCKLLPGTQNTLQFISNWFEDYYIRAAMDERFLSNHYMVYLLMDGIKTGEVQAYGVFEVKDDKAEDFCGLCFGWITSDGYYEVHLAFDRGVDTMACARLCEEIGQTTHAKHKVPLKGLTGPQMG
jgi:hypothetical protein